MLARTKERVIYMQILNYFPEEISKILKSYLEENKEDSNILEEIRLRGDKPIILKFYDYEKVFTNNRASSEDILRTLEFICENSIYSYQNQICNGYVTVHGGHRVGISRQWSIRKKQNN